MKKNKSHYQFNFISRFHNGSGIIMNKWEIIKKFISFLRNKEELQIQITKVNNFLISQNQTWEYNKEKENYILETDLRGKENHELWHKDKYVN